MAHVKLRQRSMKYEIKSAKDPGGPFESFESILDTQKLLPFNSKLLYRRKSKKKPVVVSAIGETRDKLT